MILTKIALVVLTEPEIVNTFQTFLVQNGLPSLYVLKLNILTRHLLSHKESLERRSWLLSSMTATCQLDRSLLDFSWWCPAPQQLHYNNYYYSEDFKDCCLLAELTELDGPQIFHNTVTQCSKVQKSTILENDTICLWCNSEKMPGEKNFSFRIWGKLSLLGVLKLATNVYFSVSILT